MRRFTTLVVSTLFVGLLAACGDDDTEATAPSGPDDDATAQATPGAEIESDDPGDASSGSGSAGTVTVDGTTFGLDDPIQCDTSEFLVVADEEYLFEGVAFGSSDDGRVRFEVSITDLTPTMDMHSVQWQGPGGVFSNTVVGSGDAWSDPQGADYNNYTEPPVTFAGTRATGTMVLRNDRATDETIEVTFDVVFPEQLTSCRS